jgi:hypothetical protein
MTVISEAQPKRLIAIKVGKSLFINIGLVPVI